MYSGQSRKYAILNNILNAYVREGGKVSRRRAQYDTTTPEKANHAMKYVEKPDIIERSLFTRLMHIACGRYALGVERKMMRNTGGVIPSLANESIVDVFSELYDIYQLMSHKHEPHNADRILNDLAFSVFVHEYRKRRTADRNGAEDFLPMVIDEAKELWKDFELWGKEKAAEFFPPRADKNTGRSISRFSMTRWKRNERFPRDVAEYVSLLERDGEALQEPSVLKEE